MNKRIGAATLVLSLALMASVQAGWFQTVRETVGEWLDVAGAAPPASPQTLPAQGTIEVAFSPPGGGTAMIVQAIDQARERIWVQAYSFTSAPIAKALIHAARRGVQVVVVLDKSQRSARYSEADFFANQSVPTYIDDQHAIAHNKVMVIDKDTVITGSFNFTKAAEQNNAENVLVLRGNPQLNEIYAQNFLYHRAHSTPYAARYGTD